jgi:hypothetical protein
MKRMIMLAGALALALSSAACTDLASGVAGLATDLSSSTPAQVTTYGEATAAATLATRTVDLAVTTLTLNKATLTELNSLNEAVHTAWLQLKAANDAGQSLSFASFNAALAAYQSYRVSQGIPEAPATTPSS